MLLTPSQILDLTFKTLDVRFKEGYSSVKNLMVDRLAMATTTTAESVKYGWPDLVPMPREFVDERTFHSVSARQQEIVNRTWELSLQIPKDKLEDQQVELYGPMAESMGRELAIFWDRRLTDVIEAASSTVCFDGQNFFSATHPIDPDGVVTASTQANLTTGAALTATTYAAGIANGKTLKGRDNQPLGMFMDPASTILMVHPALEKTAREILHAEYISVTGGSTQNNVWQNSAQLLVNPYLLGTNTTWYLFDTSRPIKPFVKQVRSAPILIQKTSNDSDEVFKHRRYLYGSEMRGDCGIGLWFMAQRFTA